MEGERTMSQAKAQIEPTTLETANCKPTGLTQIDDKTLGINWSDGTATQYNVRDLRIACRCAVCVDEMTGERRLSPSSVPENVQPMAIKPIGHYALHIHWSDGHQSGFYRYDFLYNLAKS